MTDASVAQRASASVEEWIALYNANKSDGAFLTIVDLIEQCCSDFADNLAVTNFGCTLTYQALCQLSTQFASFLQHHYKIKKGDRVAIMMPNCLQYYVVLHAILRVGAVVVNVNPLYKPRELQHQLNDAECETIVIMSMSASTLSEILSSTPVKNIVLTNLGDMLGAVRGTIINVAIKYIKRLIKPFHLPQAIAFKQALALGSQQSFERVNVLPGDIAFLQYTGGTTGVAKGAMLSHANMCANVWQARVWAGKRLAAYAKTALCPLPLYHIFSLMINAFSVLTVGGHVVLVTDPRDIPGLVKLFYDYPVTMFTSLNTLYVALLRNEKFRQCNFSALKLAIGGGMATRPSVAEEWQKVTKNCIVDGYGMTETSPVISMNAIDSVHFSGTIGKPAVNTLVEIRDDHDQSLPVGEVGEICVKGPQVMVGYWKKPEETALVLSADGWLKTGDIGRFDAQGLLTLVDRKKELISVSGFKVYPNEVEEVLTSLPGVLEAAVIGVPDEATGERVKAFIIKKDPLLTAETVLAYCHENLTGYKRPHEVVFRDTLPKSNVGKVLRRALRDEENNA